MIGGKKSSKIQNLVTVSKLLPHHTMAPYRSEVSHLLYYCIPYSAYLALCLHIHNQAQKTHVEFILEGNLF